MIEPSIPVIIIATTATEGSPPNCLDNAIPIGVVMDLGINDFVSSLERLNAFESRITDIIPDTAPNKIPDKIGKAFSLNKENFLYNGNANAIVAGAKKKEIICPPLL